MRFSIFLLCLDAADWDPGSLSNLLNTIDDVPLHCAVSSDDTGGMAAFRSPYDDGRLRTLLECGKGAEPIALIRSLLRTVDTEYVLVMPRPCPLSPGWTARLARFIETRGPLDIALPGAGRPAGVYLASAAFLRSHDSDSAQVGGSAAKSSPACGGKALTFDPGVWEGERSGRDPSAAPAAPSPEDFVALNEKGNKLNNEGRFEDACRAYRQALRLAPQSAELHYNLANTLKALKKDEEAIEYFEKAIELRPDYSEALNNLGITLFNCGQAARAIEAYHRAIKAAPGNAAPYNNLGNAYERVGDIDKAIDSLQQAAALQPDFAQTHYNLARLLARRDEYNKALLHYRLALHHRPDFVEARLGRALYLLTMGEYELGFDELRQRAKLPGFKARSFSRPEWNGGDLTGKTLLLHQEGGASEPLQLARYVPLLQDKGADVIIECCASLTRLLARIPNVEVFSRGARLPEFDVHASFLNLPLLLKTRVKTIPANVPYLTASKHSTFSVGASHHALKVGVLWRDDDPAANPALGCSIKHFQRLYDISGVTLVGLNQTHTPDEDAFLKRLPFIQQPARDATDYFDIAAIVRQLDLVITTETPLAHLAGAMGTPAWVLLSRQGGWQWPRLSRSTPWYPSARLYWQRSDGDWAGILEDVAVDLEQKVEKEFQRIRPAPSGTEGEAR